MPNKNLVIGSADTYGVVASEIVADMECFEKIAFVDDERKITANSIEVIGTIQNIDELVIHYRNVIVAIGNPETKLSLLNKISKEIRIALFHSFLPKPILRLLLRL